jgi:CRISPR-associated protein Cmr2
MVSTQPFHFTLGPVHGFVSQARRTRDLWAGSYLLSYLSGIAMMTIGAENVIFPSIVKDPLFVALSIDHKPGKDDHAARVGSLPNRFKAKAEDVRVMAAAAEIAIRSRWLEIAGKLWKKFETEANKNFQLTTTGTKDIWDRQVRQLWEIAWVSGDDGALLDQRKNLRSHFHSEEPGEKCTLCGERQALSKGDTDTRQTVRKWWINVSSAFGGFHFLKEGEERLCGICTIKRIFPLAAQDVIGWKVHHNYPSTAYMCAIDWLKKVLRVTAQNPNMESALRVFIQKAREAGVPCDETGTTITGIMDLLKDHASWKPLAYFSGDTFFTDSIRNKKDLPLKDETKRETLQNALEALTKEVGEKPSPFYAILLMDGDNMGGLLSEFQEKQDAISNALLDFTSKVDDIVEKDNDGRLVYAGGDDVFAILPLDTALFCAKRLRETYVNAFQRHIPEIRGKGGGTISACIVYAHMNTSLQTAVRDAHALLDKTAKDALGRDAFAVRVWKRGGPILTYGRKWVEKDLIGEIYQFRDAYNRDEFSSGFLYRFKELETVLNMMSDHQERVQLLTAEYFKSREKIGLPDDPAQKRELAEERIKRLIALCTEKEKISSNGPLFIRFLAEKEVGR